MQWKKEKFFQIFENREVFPIYLRRMLLSDSSPSLPGLSQITGIRTRKIIEYRENAYKFRRTAYGVHHKMKNN